MEFSEILKLYFQQLSTPLPQGSFHLLTQGLLGDWSSAEGRLGVSTISDQTVLVSFGETPWHFFRSASDPTPTTGKLKLTLNVSSFTPSSAGTLENIEFSTKLPLSAVRARGMGKDGDTELEYLLVCEDTVHLAMYALIRLHCKFPDTGS